MKAMNLMMPVETPKEAVEAQAVGIERAFYDMEFIGSLDRHYGRNAAFACRPIDIIPEIKKQLSSTELVVRVNSDKSYSKIEVEKAIKYGADILMIPMVIDQHQVEEFVKMVGGRAKVCVMIETAAAFSRLTRILKVNGVDEIYVGINDLHLSMGLSHVLEPLRDSLIDYVAEKCNMAGIPFGFGSIARIGDGIVPAECILGEHIRLGSTSTLLAKTFFYPETASRVSRQFNLGEEISLIRETLASIDKWNQTELSENHLRVVNILDEIAYSRIN